MRFQALQTLAPTNAHDESRRRDVRLGVNGSWRDNYRFGVPNKQEMIGGTNHLLSAYAMRGQKIWGQHGRIRVGVKNLLDLENSRVRKTGFVTLANGANVDNDSCVMPPQYDLTVTVKF